MGSICSNQEPPPPPPCRKVIHQKGDIGYNNDFWSGGADYLKSYFHEVISDYLCGYGFIPELNQN